MTEMSHKTTDVFGITRDLPLNYVVRPSADDFLIISGLAPDQWAQYLSNFFDLKPTPDEILRLMKMVNSAGDKLLIFETAVDKKCIQTASELIHIIENLNVKAKWKELSRFYLKLVGFFLRLHPS